jgi:hypothetical protein
MDANSTDVDGAVAEIRRYFREHPNAADTLEGVAVWWLSGTAGAAWLATVQRALDRLLATGEAAKRTLIDGTVIYERNKQDGPN